MTAYRISLLAICIFFSGIAKGQGPMVHQDSAAANVHATNLLSVMDSTRRSDSTRRAELLAEIDKIEKSDKKQREALQRRLRNLERGDSLRAIKLSERLSQLKATAKGYPVAPFGDTLMMVYTNVASFSAQERSQAIAGKIKSLTKEFGFYPDSMFVQASENSHDIVYKDLIVMSINPMDAMWFDVTQEKLANDYMDKMKVAMKEEMDENRILNIFFRIGAVILILIGIYFLIRLINKLFLRVVRKVSRMKDHVIKGIKFKGYQFLDSDRELKVIFFALKVFRLVLIVVALYITLPLLFSVFPWTRGFAETLLHWVTAPLGKLFRAVISYLPNLFYIGIIIAITHYVLTFFRFVSDEIEKGALNIPGFYPDWSKPTYNIIKVLLYAFMFIMMWPYLPGSGSPVFQGVSVFLGILVSLGSSSAISNAVAGLVITYMRPFKVGDRIKIGDVVGDVVDKSTLVTRIRTIKNEDITIPNAAILSGHTINYTTSAKERGLILHTSVTIGYDVPWRQVHSLLIEAALATQGISKEGKQPFVFQTSLDDYYVEYQINAYTDDPQRMAVIYSALHQHIQDKFNEAGVEIMSPHYRAMRDGNTITIPPKHYPPKSTLEGGTK